MKNKAVELQKTQDPLNIELARRLRAAFYLRGALNKEEPYKELYTPRRKNAYKRNMQMGGLEFHMMGSQAEPEIGCKSARDRTAIMGAVFEAMLKNPETMMLTRRKLPSRWKSIWLISSAGPLRCRSNRGRLNSSVLPAAN